MLLPGILGIARPERRVDPARGEHGVRVELRSLADHAHLGARLRRGDRGAPASGAGADDQNIRCRGSVHVGGLARWSRDRPRRSLRSRAAAGCRSACAAHDRSATSRARNALRAHGTLTRIRFTPLMTAVPRGRGSLPSTSGRRTSRSGWPDAGAACGAIGGARRTARAAVGRETERWSTMAGLDERLVRHDPLVRCLQGQEGLQAPGSRMVRMEVHCQAAIRSLHVGQ